MAAKKAVRKVRKMPEKVKDELAQSRARAKKGSRPKTTERVHMDMSGLAQVVKDLSQVNQKLEETPFEEAEKWTSIGRSPNPKTIGYTLDGGQGEVEITIHSLYGAYRRKAQFGETVWLAPDETFSWHVPKHYAEPVRLKTTVKAVEGFQPALEFVKEEDLRDNNVMSEALKIIYGDREKTYGRPSVNLESIAQLWSTYLGRRATVRGEDNVVDINDVCQMMVLLKMARLINDPTHHDSMVDQVGYIGLQERVQL